MKKYNYILLFAFIIELGMLTFSRGIAGIYVSPFILLISSLFIGIYPIVLSIRRKLKRVAIKELPTRTRIIIVSLISLFGIVFCGIILSKVLHQTYAETKISHTFTIINLMAERFIHGYFPYESIKNWGYIIYPNFMPLHFMPFILSELLHFDYRWIVFFIWVVSILLFDHYLVRKKILLSILVILAALPYFILFIYIKFSPEVITSSAELLIAGYYIILCLSLFLSSIIYRSIGLVVTILSRFSAILWTPFYVVILFIEEKKWKSVRIGLIVIISILLFYILPFLTRNPKIFNLGQRNRTETTLKVWEAESPNTHNLSTGIGFAYFFYKFHPGTIKERMLALKKLHITITVLSILVLFIIYILLQGLMDYPFYLLLSLKIYLTLYYNFYHIPYTYLFIVTVFISMIVLSEFYNRNNIEFLPKKILNKTN